MTFAKVIEGIVYLGTPRSGGTARTFNAVGSGGNIDVVVNSKGTGKFKSNSAFVYGTRAADGGIGENGEIYYNTASQKFRAYENGAWLNLIGASFTNQNANLVFAGPASGAAAAPAFRSLVQDDLPRGQTIVAATTYTILASDLGKILFFTNGAGCAVTLPNSFTANFDVTLVRDTGAGLITIAAATTLVTSGSLNTLESAGAWATFIHKGSNIWYGSGELGSGGGGSGITDGDKGDITVGSSGSVWTIDNNVVNFAKMQNSAAGLSLIGRAANSGGDFAEITAASDFQILRRSGTSIAFGAIDLSQSNAVGSSVLGVGNGGTGLGTYTTGDIIYATGTTTLGKFGIGANGTYLTVTGGVPTWATISTFSLTDGKGTTANGTAVDLGGVIGSSNAGFTGTGSIVLTNNHTSLGSLIVAPSGTLTGNVYAVSIAPATTVTGSSSLPSAALGFGNTTLMGANTSYFKGIYFANTIGANGFTGTVFTGYHYKPGISGTLTHYAMIIESGSIGIQTVTPTAKMHFGAHSATAGTAPIKLTTGTAMTTPEDGAIEYHASHLYFTVGSTRYQIDQQIGSFVSGSGTTFTGSNKYDLGGALTGDVAITGTGRISLTNYNAASSGGLVVVHSSITIGPNDFPFIIQTNSATVGSTGPNTSATMGMLGSVLFGANSTIHSTIRIQQNANANSKTGVTLRGIYYNPTITGTMTHHALVLVSGLSGFNVATPTARVHIAAGTATASTAPLKLTTGTALTTPEDGALEYHTSHLYFTVGSTRYQLDQQGGSIADGDKGDITVGSSGTVWTIDNDVVTYAKMQNVSATGRVLGRKTTGAGDVEELTDIILGNSADSGTARDISVSGSASDVSITLTPKGFGVTRTPITFRVGGATDDYLEFTKNGITHNGTGSGVLTILGDAPFGASSNGGTITIQTQNGGASGGIGGEIQLICGGGPLGWGRMVLKTTNIQLGINDDTDQECGLRTWVGNATTNNGQGLNINAGSAYSIAGNGNGGNITLQSGSRRVAGSGVDGNINIDPLTGFVNFLITAAVSAATPSTHKLPIKVNGTTMYILLTT